MKDLAQIFEPGKLIKVCENPPNCTYQDLIELAKAVMETILIVGTIAATIAFMWAGFQLLTSGGNGYAKEKAKNVFESTLKGFVWMLIAWLVVYTIMSVLTEDGFNQIIR
jgi:hypothetical protein